MAPLGQKRVTRMGTWAIPCHSISIHVTPESSELRDDWLDRPPRLQMIAQ